MTATARAVGKEPKGLKDQKTKPERRMRRRGEFNTMPPRPSLYTRTCQTKLISLHQNNPLIEHFGFEKTR